MKKFFRILCCLILLLGIGSTYIIKNPTLPISQRIFDSIGLDITQHPRLFPQSATTGVDLTNCTSYFDGCNTCTVEEGKLWACTLMYCEQMGTPTCLQYQQTGVDLTNCTSYFDGCNTCMVEHGKIGWCTKMNCTTLWEPACLATTTWTTPDTSVSTLANPASTYCVEHQGKLHIQDTDDGQVGICTFADKSTCEERAYMRGECAPKSTASLDDTPSVCTMEYAPVCARVQVECVTTPCEPIQQTFGNKCQMNANNHATYLHDGECTQK